jgi:hypothetical protein
MAEEQRHGALRAGNVDEVQLDAADVRRELRQRVDARLVPSPIKGLPPVGQQGLQRREAGAGRPCGQGRLVGQPGARQALAQVGERIFGNVNFEGVDGGIFVPN